MTAPAMKAPAMAAGPQRRNWASAWPVEAITLEVMVTTATAAMASVLRIVKSPEVLFQRGHIGHLSIGRVPLWAGSKAGEGFAPDVEIRRSRGENCRLT